MQNGSDFDQMIRDARLRQREGTATDADRTLITQADFFGRLGEQLGALGDRMELRLEQLPGKIAEEIAYKSRPRTPREHVLRWGPPAAWGTGGAGFLLWTILELAQHFGDKTIIIGP